MTVWATRADQVDLRGPNPHDLARSLEQSLEQLDLHVGVWVGRQLPNEVVVDDADVGPLDARRCVDVDDSGGSDDIGDDLTDRSLQFDTVAGAVRAGAPRPTQLHRNCLEERQVISEAQSLWRRNGEGEGLTGDAGVLQ